MMLQVTSVAPDYLSCLTSSTQVLFFCCKNDIFDIDLFWHNIDTNGLSVILIQFKPIIVCNNTSIMLHKINCLSQKKTDKMYD